MKWYKNFGSRLFCFVTMLAFDRQTDRQTEMRQQLSNTVLNHSQSHGKNGKKCHYIREITYS